MSRSRDLYVALGDSTGVGYGAAPEAGYVARIHARLARAGAPHLVNLASTGARSACVAAEQLPRVPAARTSLVTVGVGANDVVHRTPLDHVRRAWERLGAALAAARAPVVVANVPDLSLAPVAVFFPRATYEDRVVAINAIIAGTCARHGFVLADLHEATRAMAGPPTAPGRPARTTDGLFCSDGFHPSADGYATLTETWWPAVEAALAMHGRGR